MRKSRDEGIDESHRLRDLGRYAEALTLLNKIAADDASLTLALEICRLLLRMGRIDQACEIIATALEKYSDSEHDSLVLIHAQWFYSANIIMCTARPSEPMKVLIGIYNKYLKTRLVEDYDERLVDHA